MKRMTKTLGLALFVMLAAPLVAAQHDSGDKPMAQLMEMMHSHMHTMQEQSMGQVIMVRFILQNSNPSFPMVFCPCIRSHRNQIPGWESGEDPMALGIALRKKLYAQR